MEYILDAAGVVADALLVWWIAAGSNLRHEAEPMGGQCPAKRQEQA